MDTCSRLKICTTDFIVKTGIEEYNIAAHEVMFRSNSNSDQEGMLLCSCKKLFHVGRRSILTAYSFLASVLNLEHSNYENMTRGSNG